MKEKELRENLEFWKKVMKNKILKKPITQPGKSKRKIRKWKIIAIEKKKELESVFKGNK